MRGKKATLNTALNLLEQFVALLCGLILPRLILAHLGSRYNGLTVSISQFLSCAVLLRSGIGGATRAALYKPIAENDRDEIDSIVKATDIFMKKIGLILAGLIVVFAVLYPLLVKNEFGWFFTFSLFLIIGASTFAESFFGITYLVVLQADQRLWVTSLLKIICVILNTALGAVLLISGCSIHAVKAVAAAVYVAYPIVLGAYVKRHYKINTHAEPNNKAIAQRWDAFWQQVAVFVTNNTDVMVLTVFSNMLEVSVYAVYNMVIDGLKRVLLAFSNGLEAAFGNMIAKNEDDLLRENLAIVETTVYCISTFLFTCAAILILPFVKIYTNSITDVDYIRPAFAYTLIAASFFNGVRIPYQLVVQAAGHYKQTKVGAIIEPIINLTLSIILVFNYGLIGVAVGTLAATVFRTVQYSVYMSRNIVKRSIAIVLYRIAVSALECALTMLLVDLIDLPEPDSYASWFKTAFIVAGVCLAVVGACSFIFHRKDVRGALGRLKNVFVHK
jgi:O-antigen/teichoic acid export membrane protein